MSPCPTFNEFKNFILFYEWCIYLDNVVMIPHIVITSEFNFYVDNNCVVDASRFCSVLDCCALVQHITDSTHKRGHTLDMVISRE